TSPSLRAPRSPGSSTRSSRSRRSSASSPLSSTKRWPESGPTTERLIAYRSLKMMTIEGSYVGTLQDLKELLELGRAGKLAPIPIESRSAERATESLTDLKTGGKVRGRVVLAH